MRDLLIAILLVIVLLSCDQANTVSASYSTQQECEVKGNCRCSFVMCDYIPEGKTYEEVCGKNFSEGWQCVA